MYICSYCLQTVLPMQKYILLVCVWAAIRRPAAAWGNDVFPTPSQSAKIRHCREQSPTHITVCTQSLALPTYVIRQKMVRPWPDQLDWLRRPFYPMILMCMHVQELSCVIHRAWGFGAFAGLNIAWFECYLLLHVKAWFHLFICFGLINLAQPVELLQ